MPLLFAQQAADPGTAFVPVWVLLLIAADLLILLTGAAAVIAVFRQKHRVQEWDHAERLRMLDGFFRSARQLVSAGVRAQHPDWDQAQIDRETARRLSHGAF